MARRNPLNAWHQLGPLERLDRQSKPMMSVNAPRVYKEFLSRVGLPLAVVVGLGPQSEEVIRREQEAGNTVLWMPVAWTTAEVMMRAKGAKNFKLMLDSRPKWDLQRISPMTPFTLLHRLGDGARNKLRGTESLTRLDRIIAATEMERGFDARHVDTLAGRHGAFQDVHYRGGQEATSDLFAKYLLTGRIAYRPSGYHTKVYLAELQTIFPQWVEMVRGKVFDLILGVETSASDTFWEPYAQVPR